MSTIVLLHLQLPQPAVTADAREPLSEAMLEVSARVAAAVSEQRRLHSRVEELGSGDPSLRRSKPRAAAPTLPRPVTFFSIEEADSEAPGRQVRSA